MNRDQEQQSNPTHYPPSDGEEKDCKKRTFIFALPVFRRRRRPRSESAAKEGQGGMGGSFDRGQRVPNSSSLSAGRAEAARERERGRLLLLLSTRRLMRTAQRRQVPMRCWGGGVGSLAGGAQVSG